MAYGNFITRLDQIDVRVGALEKLLGINQQIIEEPEETELEILDEESPAPLAQPPRPKRVLPPVVELVEATAPPSNRSTSLEQTIGLKWAGWIGAVVLVIGAAFGIRFGYEQGWFSFVTPAVRLGLLAMMGFILIGAGEWVYRRINALSAVGLFGAGIALLFVISYAGQAYYGLYQRNTAFAFMVVSMLIGVAVARRGRTVSIAVLAMIGGNLAPLLLQGGVSGFVGFFLYLLVLQRTSLLLATWGGTPRWWTLRGLSLATTSLWMWHVMDAAPVPLTMVFGLLYAALFHYELNASAHRCKLDQPRSGVTFSMLVTVAITFLILHLESDATHFLRVASVLAIGLVTGVICLVNHRFGKGSPLVRSLAAGYAIQSLALAAVAVPIALSGVWIGLGWSVLAIACAVTARSLKLPSAGYASVVGWALAGFHLVWWFNLSGDMEAHRRALAFSFNGCTVPMYLVMGWSFAMVGQIIARLNQPMSRFEESRALAVVSSLVWFAVSLAGLSQPVATASILVYGSLLLAVNWFGDDKTALAQSTVIILLATIKWALVDTLLERFHTTPIAASALFSSTQLAGLISLGSLALLYAVAGMRADLPVLGTNPRRKIGWVMTCLIFWFVSFGIDQAFTNDRLSADRFFANPDHAEQVALSIFWAMFALGNVTFGLIRRVAGMRYLGLTLFAITLLKVATIDLSQVSTGYRILSFMALGVLLLGTSVLYGKLSPRMLVVESGSSAKSSDVA